MAAAEAVRGLSQRLGEPWLRWSLGTYQVDLPLPKKDCQTTETTMTTHQRCWDEDPDGEGGLRRLWYVGLVCSWKCIVHSLCLHSAIVKLEAWVTWVTVRPALHHFGLKVCFLCVFLQANFGKWDFLGSLGREAIQEEALVRASMSALQELEKAQWATGCWTCLYESDLRWSNTNRSHDTSTRLFSDVGNSKNFSAHSVRSLAQERAENSSGSHLCHPFGAGQSSWDRTFHILPIADEKLQDSSPFAGGHVWWCQRDCNPTQCQTCIWSKSPRYPFDLNVPKNCFCQSSRTQ